jgi:hypothetical protein
MPKQKHLTKREVLKLKAGTWIEVSWADSPNSVGLLLERPEKEPGDVSLRVFWPDTESDAYNSSVNSSAVHSQVVRALGTVEVPEVED